MQKNNKKVVSNKQICMRISPDFELKIKISSFTD